MTHTRFFLLVLASGVAIFGSPALAQKPDSFVMTCKPGANQVEFDNRVEQIKGSAPVTSAYIRYMFTRSRGAASAGLAPGQCAWADRAVASGEPVALELHFRDARLVPFVTQTTGGTTINYRVRGRSQTRSAGETDLLSFIRAFERGTEFHVHAYNDRNQTLVVTRFGP